MDEWQKEVSELVETVAEQVEEFFSEFSRDFTEVVNFVVDVSEEISNQINNMLTDEVEQYVTELVSPVLEAYFGLGGFVDEATQPVIQTVDPLLKQHPLCTGCRHFHGQMYSGNLLVCGMHPYGVDEGMDACPDKEMTVWKSPGFSSDGRFFFGSDEDW